MDQPFELIAMSPDEEKAMQAEISAVLEKYNAEIGIKSTIQVWKRQAKSIVSPIQPGQNNDENQSPTN